MWMSRGVHSVLGLVVVALLLLPVLARDGRKVLAALFSSTFASLFSKSSSFSSTLLSLLSWSSSFWWIFATSSDFANFSSLITLLRMARNVASCTLTERFVVWKMIELRGLARARWRNACWTEATRTAGLGRRAAPSPSWSRRPPTSGRTQRWL